MTSQQDERILRVMREGEEAVRNITSIAKRKLTEAYAKLDSDTFAKMATENVKKEARLRGAYARTGDDKARRECVATFVENHFIMEENARRIRRS